MPFSRRYQTFEVRRLLQNAERNVSPITNAGAHSRGLHAMRSPGGVGVNKAEMFDRTHKRSGESNKQFKNRGGAVRTSTFKNVIEQAEAACQALNSTKGQAALRVLDMQIHDTKNLRVMLDVGAIKQAGFLNVPAPRMQTVHKSHGKMGADVGAEGVRIIIDRAAGQTEIHIQTCFPLDGLNASTFKVIDMDTKGSISTG